MKILQRFSLFLGLSLLLPFGQLCAQVGGNNPAGPFGIFNGNVTTGCSYDPYTGNAMRSIPDISVAGAVGSYGLALSRTYNSRNGIGFSYGFSGWRHSYEWTMDDSPITNTQNFPPSSYSVNFPDGRHETFIYSASDIYFRASAGIRERFQPLNLSTMLAYLILPDGGKIEFKATQQSQYDGELHVWSYWYTYVAQAIIDPYGQRTTLTYNPNGTLQKVTEPAGRTLQFYYITVGTNTVLDHVTGSDGRTVQYYYIQSAFSPGTTVYVVLDHVIYYGDSTWTARYRYRAPNTGSANGIPLLWTCDDPVYPGPMRGIAYTYRSANNPDGSTAVFGQLQSENYYNTSAHTVGSPVSTLTVGAANNSNVRTETRGDGPTRTFTYLSTGYLSSCTDFANVRASQAYDGNGYINSVTDRNNHTTNFTCNALTGGLTQVTYPLTTVDTPGQTQRPTVTYTYGSASCFDGNNQDANNPYYPCTVTDEGGHITKFTRDTSKRVTRIDYPDTGYEAFGYNSFGEVTSHRMTAGGTETFTYDATGLKLTYRNPYRASGNPSAWYQYDGYGRVSGVTDVLGGSSGDVNHTTSFAYNLRGQVITTTHPTDPVDQARHSIQSIYNADGTLASRSDELGHVTSFIYDDYRRVTSVTTPLRFTGDNTPHTTSSSYWGPNGTGWYTHTDSNATQLGLPSGKLITNTYDANYRKTSFTAAAADGVTDGATTRYGYDNVGNLTAVTSPLAHPTTTAYDERNRPYSVTQTPNPPTTFTYDTAGHKKTVTRPNGQLISYDSFDAMNRLLQQTAYQDPSPHATTKYTYTAAGLLATMQDPHLVAIQSTDNYSYVYDAMGRKGSITYPAETGGAHRVEYFGYDTASRLSSYQNRWAKVQTFTYDALNRMTGFTWNDNLTPGVTFGYDIASRLKSIVNANATISRSYWNDNLLDGEVTTYADNTDRTVSYTYDADNNRAAIEYPGNRYYFSYTYTGRNQLKSIVDNNSTTIAIYWYDVDSNLIQRNLGNSTSSSYTYDALDRVTNITHPLVGDTRTFDYDYDSVGNRKWTKREGNVGDAFGYDLNDQVTAVKLNIANPDTAGAGSQTIIYDANGNLVWFTPYGNEHYFTNNLNQYTSRNTTNAAYDFTGNLATGLDGSTYTYDAQNRLLTATNGGTTETFAYDGLNRQVSRTIAGVTTYNVYDGWDLIGEYAAGATVPTAAYVSGAGGLVKNLTTNNYYYQDASGSTSHLADSTGHLIEWYRYDLQGTPVFYNASNTQLSASNFGVRHLFTGQQWYSELGLYDLRNRYYSPDIGRFLQADPAGFSGDSSNLYRYCGNNSLKRSDPTGLGVLPTRMDGGSFGDRLDIGNWVGDGTGSVGWGLTGNNGENSTIFNNPYYTDSQVASIGQMDGFSEWNGGMAYFTIGGQSMMYLGMTNGNSVYTMSDGTSVITVGQQNVPNWVEKTFGGGATAGWDTRNQDATVAIDSGWSYAGDNETGGLLFQNNDGSFGYTIAYKASINDPGHSAIGWFPSNYGYISSAVGLWHIHPDASNPKVNVYSPEDTYNIGYYGLPSYLGTPNGTIQMLLPGASTPTGIRN